MELKEHHQAAGLVESPWGLGVFAGEAAHPSRAAVRAATRLGQRRQGARSGAHSRACTSPGQLSPARKKLLHNPEHKERFMARLAACPSPSERCLAGFGAAGSAAPVALPGARAAAGEGASGSRSSWGPHNAPRSSTAQTRPGRCSLQAPPLLPAADPSPTAGASDKLVQPRELEGQTQPWQTRSVAFQIGAAGRVGRAELWSTQAAQRAGPAASTAPRCSPSSCQPSPLPWGHRPSSVPPVGHWKKHREPRASLAVAQPHLPSARSAHTGIECPPLGARSPPRTPNPQGRHRCCPLQGNHLSCPATEPGGSSQAEPRVWDGGCEAAAFAPQRVAGRRQRNSRAPSSSWEGRGGWEAEPGTGRSLSAGSTLSQGSACAGEQQQLAKRFQLGQAPGLLQLSEKSLVCPCWPALAWAAPKIPSIRHGNTFGKSISAPRDNPAIH